MMRRIVISVFLASISVLAYSHTNNFGEEPPEKKGMSKAEKAILANFSKQEECWNNHDLECYVEAYYPSDDVQTVSRAGVTKGLDNILRDYQRYYTPDRMGKLHFDEIEMKKLSSKYYYVVGRFNLKLDGQDALRQGWFSVIMEKINGSWYMISDHSS